MFRVFWHGRTDLTEVPGRYEYKNVAPVPRASWHRRTALTEGPGTGMNAVHNSQKFMVQIILAG